MAYMSQERKRSLAPGIKAVLKKYGMKGTLSVDGHSGLRLTLTESKLDFGTTYHQVNTYHPSMWEGRLAEFLIEVIGAMNVGNHDNSDISTDYFDIGWYVYVNIGKWNKPYRVTK
jgi:hypothetical protein